MYNFKWERHIRMLTLEDVAKRTGLSIGAISAIELGKANPKVETVQKLCECYDLD